AAGGGPRARPGAAAPRAARSPCRGNGRRRPGRRGRVPSRGVELQVERLQAVEQDVRAPARLRGVRGQARVAEALQQSREGQLELAAGGRRAPGGGGGPPRGGGRGRGGG